MNLFNAARRICEAFTYDPGHSDLDNEQPIAIHCTLGDWRRLNSALMLAGQRAEPEGVFIPKDIADFCLESAMMLRHRLEIAPNSPEYRRVCEVQTKLEDAISRLEPQSQPSGFIAYEDG